MNDSRTSKPWQPAHALQAAEKLDEIAELADALGIELPILEEVREDVSRARRFVDELRGASEDSSALTTRIGHGLATGELDLESAAAAIIRAQPTPILKTAVRRSEEIAARRAFTEAASNFPAEAVLERGRAIAAEALAEIRKLREPLDGITSGEQATEAGAKTAKAWVEYRTQLTRFEKAHELVAQLRELEWIKPLPRGLNGTYGRIDLVREDKRRARKAKQTLRSLLDPRCDRWLAGGPYTEAEAKRFRDEMDDEHEAEEQELQAVGDPVARVMRRAAAEERV